MKVLVIFGTRPEAIKLAPVITSLQARDRSEKVQCRTVITAQHRELLNQALDVFGIRPDYDLDLMRPQQTLAELTCRALPAIEKVLRAERADLVVVQGDTTSTFVSSLAAFYQKIPVAHVEAGLRSHHGNDPFPEEANRRLTSVLAQLHFAPTELARDNLLRENVSPETIFVTGNTIVDALKTITASEKFQEVRLPFEPGPGRRLLLVTLHRRESWGERLEGMCQALRDIIRTRADVEIAFPVHPNPVVRDVVRAALGGTERISLFEPLDYLTFLAMMNTSSIVLTDSGGVQEEAPVLGKPVLVLRNATERPETLLAGVAKLVGTRAEDIVSACEHLLDDAAAYQQMARAVSPFGDGQAARRIADVITWRAHSKGPLSR